MKKIVVIILAVLLISTLAFTGCTPKIPVSRLNYFKGLTGQTFWTDKPLNIDVEKDDNQKITLFADIKEGTFEGINFGNVTITQESDKGVPQVGYITVKIVDSKGEELSSYKLAINGSNEKTIKKLLAQMKTAQQNVIIESKNLINKGDFSLAIPKLKNIQGTDEVKTLLDSAYYGLATEDFKTGNYDKAISDLSNVKFDKGFIRKKQKLQSKIQQQLFDNVQELMDKAEYSQAKEKLLQIQKINDSQTARNLLAKLNDPWLLDADAIKRAIAYGKNNKNLSSSNFLKLWSIGNIRAYREFIFVMTPYSLVAFASHMNAKKYKDTTLSDALGLIEDSGGRLRILAVVFGDKVDFAKDIDAVIKVNGKAIQPLESDREDFAETTPRWPYSPAYTATNNYSFALKDIPRDAKIQFILIYSDHEKTFNVDLSKFK